MDTEVVKEVILQGNLAIIHIGV